MTAQERAIDPQARLQDALDAAYRHLGFRDRTVAEVRRHLERRRVEPETIDAAIAELQRLDYLDDARFAQRFAEDRRRLDDWGPERIERKLRAAGVDAAHVQAALAARPAGAELDAAVGLLARRFPSAPADDRERERALGLLARKGYDIELAYDAVRAFERSA